MAKTKCPFCEEEIELSQSIQPCPECNRLLLRCAKCSEQQNKDSKDSKTASMPVARFCVNCKDRLVSPSDWPMAHANSARTSSFETLTGRINVPNWSKLIPKTSFEDPSQFHRLPALIATGGMVIVPNFQENAFDSYSITNGEHLWRTPLDGVLQYASTPVYYALSFYLILEKKLLRISLLDGGVEVVSQSPHIVPAEKCAPLVIVQYSPKNQPYRETAKLIWGLDGRILCYSVENGEGKSEFLDHSAGDSLRTPVAINPNRILFTSGKGIIYELTLEENEIKEMEVGDYSLSVPCILGGLVYFHGVTDSADRWLFNFNPKNGDINQRRILPDDSLSDVTEFETSLWYPPVVLGSYAILSDYRRQTLIRWTGNKVQSAKFETHRFTAHQSAVIKQRIFSLSESGLYSWDLQSRADSMTSLTRKSGDKPKPIGFPAVYANKLLVWCEDRLICQSIPL